MGRSLSVMGRRLFVMGRFDRAIGRGTALRPGRRTPIDGLFFFVGEARAAPDGTVEPCHDEEGP